MAWNRCSPMCTKPVPALQDEPEGLEGLVRQLEAEDLDLDKAIALFE